MKTLVIYEKECGHIDIYNMTSDLCEYINEYVGIESYIQEYLGYDLENFNWFIGEYSVDVHRKPLDETKAVYRWAASKMDDD